MTFTADIPGERLDAFLARVADMSRSAAQKLIEQGNVLKNGKKPKKNDRLEPGDTIEVEFIRFPVFNVADCFITCGCVLLIAHLVLFNKEFWKN